MIRPRPYLSFSQLAKYEMSPDKYTEEYLYGNKGRISRNMAYGSMLAKGLESEEANGDPLLDLMASRLPKFERMDMPVECTIGYLTTFNRDGREIKVQIPVLETNGDDIPILAIPDTAKPDYTAFKEYKSSTRKWTQKMVDDSGQITFYTTAIWLAKGFIPNDIELVSVQTAYDADGRLYPTGDMHRFPTKRTMSDVIKMTKRMRDAWAGIKELCEKELL